MHGGQVGINERLAPVSVHIHIHTQKGTGRHHCTHALQKGDPGHRQVSFVSVVIAP
jgi:hypothetical protein